MRKTLKALSLSVAFAMIVMFLPLYGTDFTTVFAASDYTVSSDGELTAYTGSGGNITIPSTVKKIGDDVFANNSTITGVSIPSSVTTVGVRAFAYCTNLKKVSMSASWGSGVKTISGSAFDSCETLETVTLPSTLTTIDNYAFCACSALTSITIPSSVTTIGDGAFELCTSLNSVDIKTTSWKELKPYTFRYCYGLQSITLPSSVITVGKEAFANSGLQTLTLPGYVTTIGEQAFRYCYSLTEINMPDTVTSIGVRAFEGCSVLPRISLSESLTAISDECFCYCDGLKTVYLPGSVTSVGGAAFYSCPALATVSYSGTQAEWDALLLHMGDNNEGLMNATVTVDTCDFNIKDGVLVSYRGKKEAITVPDGVTAIGDRAFGRRSELKSVTLPDGVTAIGANAFANCSGLTDVTIPDSTVTLGEYAFYNCTQLMSLPAFASVTEIGANAFHGCRGLESAVIPSCVKTIGNDAFRDCDGLTAVTIPDGVTAIGQRAFSSCEKLTSVTIPDSVQTIGSYAFAYCEALDAPVIGSGVTELSESMFYSCDGLTTAVVPDSVKVIGKSAFEGCTALVNLTIGNHVETIGDSAFEDCDALMSVTIPDSVKTINYEAFYECDKLTQVKMGKSVTTVDGSVFEDCERLQSVTLSPSLTAIGNSMFEDCVKLAGIVIPDSVQTIEYDAFEGCTALREVVMGQSVETIEEDAFYGCAALQSITLPASLKTIGEDAFGGCNGLTSLVIPDSVTLIDKEAFYECYGLTSLTLGSSVETLAYECFRGCDGLTSVVIPDSVKKIGSYAFEDCTSLKTVTLLSRNPEIGSSPFNGCTALKTVNYAGTEEEWNTLGMSIPEGVTVNYGVGGTLPTVTTQPTDVVGKAGDTAPFTVKATGEGLTYQWQLSDDNCATWRDSTTQAATYTAAISAKNQNRALRCIVKDKYGRKVISNAAFIRLSTLAITTQPVDTAAANGGAVKFAVKATGEELTYQWQLSDDAGKTWRNSSNTTNQYATTVSSTNNGRYVRCIVTDKYGLFEISNAASMKISTLAITTQPTDAAAANGGTVKFTVAAKGEGLTYQWQLSDDKGTTWRDSSTKTATYSTTLSDKNNGRYVCCVVTDQYGVKVISDAASMKIAAALKITQHPTTVKAKNGATVTFTVKATGEGLTYQWQLSDDKGGSWRNSSNKTATYAATLSSTNNGRWVRCAVSDKYGNTKYSAAGAMKLMVITITTQPVNQTVKNGATASFKVAATGDELAYQWQLSDDAGKTWRNSSCKTANYAATVTDANNGRYVRCVITDKYGNKKNSNAAIMKLTTLKITTQPVNAKVEKGATASFKVVATGNTLTYQWQLSDDQGRTWRNSSCTSATYAATVTDTNNGRYVRCIVTDKFGNSVKSNAAIMKIK